MCDVFSLRSGLKQHEHEFWYEVSCLRRNDESLSVHGFESVARPIGQHLSDPDR